MSRRALVIAAFVGLACAVAETLLVPNTLNATTNTALMSLLVATLGVLAAGISGRVILGRNPVHRYFVLGVPILAAISSIAFESAFSSWLISQTVEFGPAPTGLRPPVVIVLVVGIVLYLIAATVYGFAGTSQGVRVGSRVGLLLLLLLSVIPLLNVLGLIGIVLTAFLRKPISPGPAPVSA